MMKEKTTLLWIDAAFSAHEKPASSDLPFTLLMPGDGEYAVALSRLAALGPKGPAGASVPDEVYLHLFASELLERIREAMEQGNRQDGPRLVLPFWPECLFLAAGLPVHGAREIQNLFPSRAEVHYVPRSAEAVAAEACRVLGDLRFDPAPYGAVMLAQAKQAGWIVEGRLS
jgi:hypothetical protein